MEQSIPTCNQYMGLDVGGTKVEAVLVDLNHQVLCHLTRPMETSSGEQSIESISRAVEAVLANPAASKGKLCAIGMGIPGSVDSPRVNLAVNLNLKNAPLGEIISNRFGIPVVLENDVRIAALGVYSSLREKWSVRNLAYLSIGTGIAAGMVINGQLYRGSHGMAGELGHVQMDSAGPRCKCGQIGCLEALASGPAIARRAQELLQAGKESMLRNYPTVDAKTVYTCAGKGDALAQMIVRKTSEYLARAIQWLVMGYDVDLVVLGGGVSHEGEQFLAPILEALAEFKEQSDLAVMLLGADKISLLPDGFNPGVWGAIALAEGSANLNNESMEKVVGKPTHR